MGLLSVTGHFKTAKLLLHSTT